MAFQRVSIVLNLSQNGNVLDFCIEKSEALKSKVQEVHTVKPQRIECEKCRNELELSLWLQKNESLVVQKLEQDPAPVKEEPELELSDSECANDIEPLLDIEEKPEVVPLKSISIETKAKKNKTETVKKKVQKGTESAVECDLCKQQFIGKKAIAVHFRTKHRGGEKTIKKKLPSKEFCYLCGKYVPKKGFKDHLMSHSDTRFECDICHKKYQVKTKIYNHMKLEHLERPNVKTCQFCGKRFLEEAKLVEHVARHENLRQFKCDQCPKDFNTPRAVHLHKIKIHKTEERKKIYCHICGHISHFKSGFEQHQLTHLRDEEKPYRCPHCSKGFTAKFSYERHVMVHTGEKPLKCELCFKGFREPNALQAHMRKHTGEKPFICSIPGCEKRYAERTCYRAHLKVHERQLKITLDKSTRKFLVGNHKTSILSNVNKF